MNRHDAPPDETPPTLPAGACDAHCHVFGPPARFPYAASRKYEPKDSPVEVLRAMHARLGVERAVIVQASAYATCNDAMVHALGTRPDAYRGVAMIDDDTGDAELDLMAIAGVRAIRFNFVQSLGGYPDPDVFNRAVARAAPLGWHVVLHVKGDDLVRLEDTIRRLPLPFVIDHMGRVEASAGVDQPAFRILLDLMRHDHAWVKISGAERMCPAPFDAAVPLARALVEARPDRVLWGTDFPHPNLAVPVVEEDLVRFLHRVVPDPTERKRILVSNAATLYGFSPMHSGRLCGSAKTPQD